MKLKNKTYIFESKDGIVAELDLVANRISTLLVLVKHLVENTQAALESNRLLARSAERVNDVLETVTLL